MYLAPLNYDRFFKKVFSDPRIAKRFLEDFLEVEIEEFEILKDKHKVTDDSAAVEFDFRCKIEGSYVIIDMQQWYKRDIVQRFFVYHSLNTCLQLEDIPRKNLVIDKATQKVKRVKNYQALEPVLTLIWMVVDSMEFKQDYMAYAMTPETAVDFIKNEQLWRKAEIRELLKERERVLEALSNETRNLDFLPKNRLIFMFQKNIARNKAMRKYERWFEFAEKTRSQTNTEEDFKEYEDDEVFREMIRRLNRGNLSEDDIVYIGDEKEFWEEMETFEKGIYEDGKKDGTKKGRREGRKEGLEEGEEIGIKKGEEIGIKKVALRLKQNGATVEAICKATGLTAEEIESL